MNNISQMEHGHQCRLHISYMTLRFTDIEHEKQFTFVDQSLLVCQFGVGYFRFLSSISSQ